MIHGFDEAVEVEDKDIDVLHTLHLLTMFTPTIYQTPF